MWKRETPRAKFADPDPEPTKQTQDNLNEAIKVDPFAQGNGGTGIPVGLRPPQDFPSGLVTVPLPSSAGSELRPPPIDTRTYSDELLTITSRYTEAFNNTRDRTNDLETAARKVEEAQKHMHGCKDAMMMAEAHRRKAHSALMEFVMRSREY